MYAIYVTHQTLRNAAPLKYLLGEISFLTREPVAVVDRLIARGVLEERARAFIRFVWLDDGRGVVTLRASGESLVELEVLS